MELSIVFPHQLFAQNPCLDLNRQVVLVEEWLYFNQYAFHVQKLIYHRASMQYYKKLLTDAGYLVSYVESTTNNQIADCVNKWKQAGIKTIHYVSTIDNWLEKRLIKAAANNGIQLKVYDSPAFINNSSLNTQFFANKKRFFQTDFYVWQRKRLNILLEEKEKPVGDKWTFDTENRLKIPANHFITPTKLPDTNLFVEEAINYVTKHFPNKLFFALTNLDYLEIVW
ncbi:MAG: cryptochrome/photolyase family protein [Chitinophagaceae bacterium]